MKIVSGKQMREIERIAIEERGVPSILLMENAALSLAKHCLRILDGKKNPKVMIVCGLGNNGGDGMALARHLYTKGIDTEIFFIGDVSKVKGDPVTYLEVVKKLEIPFKTTPPDHAAIGSCDLVVDAIFGTGLDRNIDAQYENIIMAINEHAKYVLSVDIPSGINSGTGQIMGCAVKAAETVTFAYSKTGLYIYPGAAHAGKIHVEDISLPVSGKDIIKTEILTDSEAAQLLPKRAARSNKGSFGKIMILAGSNEMPGAASLASSAAYITGGGLVNACVLENVAKVIHYWQREIITRVLPGNNGMYCKKSAENLVEEISRSDVIVLGPGIGRSSDVTEFVLEVIGMAEVPLVLDADALFALSEDINVLKKLKAPCIITPHPGEMSRLTGLPIPAILENPLEAAVNFSKKFNVVTLLKDAHTIIASPQGDVFINTTGNNSLAKAGTGDVLAGMIAGFIAGCKTGCKAEGCDPYTAGKLAAFIHGKAGEAASAELSNYSVSASDLLKHIPVIIKNLS